jgi:tetratricopeptide (TPR) repeat protein
LAHGERLSLFEHTKVCRSCASAFLEAWQLQRSQEPVPRLTNFSSILDRVNRTESALSREREQAPELVRELLQHPFPRQQTMVRNSRRFCTWGLCESLLSLSKEAVFGNPTAAVELALLAQDVAERLEGGMYGEALRQDFRGRVWMALGEALAASSDLRGAEAALKSAGEALAKGTGDPLEEARLAYLLGTLRGSQRRFDEGLVELDRAISIYRRIGDNHLQGKGFVAKGALLAKAGDPAASIRLQKQALEMLDAAREPRAFVAAQHNLLAGLTDLGHTDEALECLERVRISHRDHGEQTSLLRLKWIEAQLERQRGALENAEKLLIDVKSAFSNMEIPFDTALVGLELAALYAGQGRTVEVKQLAMEMFSIFQALEIQRETIAALMLFRQAAEAETASLALIQHIAGFLKRAQHDPALRFSPPS